MNCRAFRNRSYSSFLRCLVSYAVTLLAALILTACVGGAPEAPDLNPDIDWDVIARLSEKHTQVSWTEDVQPIIENRCIVCHGCYDAPCQLKLSSYEGLMRGASPVKVYDGVRIKAVEPTRLGIDASTPAEWRTKGFHPVLDETKKDAEDDPVQRLRDSVFYRMLRLKQLNPQPRAGLLPDSVTLGLNRKQVCTTEEGFAKFERKKPLWGMPYALPNLSESAYKTIVTWLAEGAPGPDPFVSSAAVKPQIKAWENFLNGSSKREQLVSRYLYEHLFLGHLYFQNGPNREFYRLVRSFTPPGEAIHEIPTTRPFDDPGVQEFWYRVRPLHESIVAKSHIPYELSDQRMARYRELFLEPDYTVDELPGYEFPATTNPFITYAAMPPKSRYQFMLDDARFFIQGFVKGPVCRGQVALNVIEDQFWVFFSAPKSLDGPDEKARLAGAANYLQMPSSTDTLNLLSAYGKYWKSQKEYLAARDTYFIGQLEKEGADAFAGIWNGGGTNPNAALTVFRNFDSAAVEFGLLGNYPETAWIIDFPLFERIHYLLVVGFDVFGNVGHQLNSRLFMDFLRMEGEDNFLTYLPVADRQKIRNQWYQGIRERRSKYFQEPMEWNAIESPITFKTDDPQKELYDQTIVHLGDAAGGVDYLNRCDTDDCVSDGATPMIRTADAKIRRLHESEPRSIVNSPDLTYLRVLLEGEEDIHYSLMVNKSYKNLSSLLASEDSLRRDQENDTLTVVRGFSGSYPNVFLVVPFDRLEEFVADTMAPKNLDEYQLYVAKYAIRRTNSSFWEYSDWFQKRYFKSKPVEAGVLDLSRYSPY
ncbi:MAG: isomerase [Gammaproteobacteria bacterium]|nr:isomerase [Gammaproteobacteria bacterium]MCP4091038.1 isomerase [Gammaproteobacteria bacterium]MCP4277436.1 isomerase [Gammaproteobacteria bacterium]MCP4831503.1 isomerase [Gammaproteobacteria bacterium]MCP4927726.1 isomerase [Gammaproteobacteria bacterium]